MSESLCAICGIAADRVLSRSAAGIVAVPSDTARDGHVMVVSATHARSFSGMPGPEADALMALVASTVRAAEQASGAEKCYVLRIGDNEPHLHFHIVPVSEADPPLAPHVFGERGWSAGVDPAALPPAAVFEPVFRESVKHVSDMAPRNAGRLPAWLVSLSLSLLAFGVAFAAAWRLIGPPWAGPVALVVGFMAGRAADDRMKGVPIRWANALLASACLSAMIYFTSWWLRS